MTSNTSEIVAETDLDEEKLLARRMATYWVVVINGGHGLKSYPDNLGMMVRATARTLADMGYPEEANRLYHEWRQKKGMVYGRYEAEQYEKENQTPTETEPSKPKSEPAFEVEVEGEEPEIKRLYQHTLTERDFQGFKQRFNEWLEKRSDPLEVSTRRYYKRVNKKRRKLGLEPLKP